MTPPRSHGAASTLLRIDAPGEPTAAAHARLPDASSHVGPEARPPGRLARLAREGGWVVAGQAAAVVAAFAGVRLLTALLGPAEYGRLALGLTFATFCQQLCFAPLAGAALRFYAPAVEAGDATRFGQAIRTIERRVGAGLLAAALLAAGGSVLAGANAWALLIAVALAYGAVAGVGSVAAAIMTAARHRAAAAIYQGAGEWLRFGAAAALLVMLGGDGSVALLGFLVAALVVATAQVRWVARRLAAAAAAAAAPVGEGADHASEAVWRTRLTTYGMPFVIWGGFASVQLASDRWALQSFGTAADVGRYAVVLQLGYYPAAMAAALASQLLAPVVFARAGDGTDPARIEAARRWVLRIAGLAAVALAVTVAAAAATHEAVFALLVDASFRSTSRHWPTMLFAGGLFAIAQLVNLLPLARAESRSLLAPKIVTAIAGVGFNALGAWTYGLAGVVAANVAFTTFYLAWSLWLLFRRVPTLRPAA